MLHRIERTSSLSETGAAESRDASCGGIQSAGLMERSCTDKEKARDSLIRGNRAL